MKQKKNSMADAQGVEAVMVFENPEFGKVRTSKSKIGEPLFCGKDVCVILGYRRADHAIKQHVIPFDVLKQDVSNPIISHGVDTGKTRRQSMLFVNESGLYALVFGSQLPTAQKFKQWVTSVVLPQIRKTGGYIPVNEGDTDEDVRRRTEQILADTLKEKDDLIAQQKKLLDGAQQEISLKKKLIAEQDVEIRRLGTLSDEQQVRIHKSEENILGLEKHVDELLPKAIYSDNVLDSISCYTTTQIAKELGMTAQELNRGLCAAHIQYYQSGQYMLYADFAHLGLAKSRTKTENVMCRVTEDGFKMGHVCTRTYLVWTERGRKFVHQLVERYWKLVKEYSAQRG